MKKQRYKCLLLSDVVISSSSATEGSSQSLDYIPGSKFLGIVAGQLYDERNQEATLDIFHNGTVSFGDAHLLFDNEPSLPVPFSWYYSKGESISEMIYLNHKVDNDVRKELTGRGIQLKQARSGYFTLSGKFAKIDQEFSLKSAYDREQLRSKDAQMFGYFALPEGTTWSFDVTDRKGTYSDNIEQLLTGRHRIGRSRSAEYGLIDIQPMDKLETGLEDSPEPNSDLIFVYAASNLCFYDEFGFPKAKPDATDLGFQESDQIKWNYSQVRTRIYQSWNRKRHNRDADRHIIEKGSVLAVKVSGPLKPYESERFVGAHHSEGFGKILLQPFFLLSDLPQLDFKLTNVKSQDLISSGQVRTNGNGSDQVVLDFLNRRSLNVQGEIDLDAAVNGFIQQHKSRYGGITSSQWGMVRNYAKHAATSEVLYKLLFDYNLGALYRGQTEKEWRKQGRREKLEQFIFNKNGHNPIQLTIKVASVMAKANQK